MLNQPTIDKLKGLRLDTMAAAWLEQQRTADMAKLDFDERLAMLVDAEWLSRENKRMARCLKEAKLRLSQACIEDIDYPARRELDRAVIRQLATCKWINEHQNVVITGATGTGKTFIACALAQQACRKGHRALYRRASRLADELALARADGTYARVLSRIARVDVLCIDDWGHAPMRDAERRDLVEILDDRIGLRSTIMTSQLPVTKWHDHIVSRLA
jgi:DNA replication protein DnaC